MQTINSNWNFLWLHRCWFKMKIWCTLLTVLFKCSVFFWRIRITFDINHTLPWTIWFRNFYKLVVCEFVLYAMIQLRISSCHLDEFQWFCLNFSRTTASPIVEWAKYLAKIVGTQSINTFYLSQLCWTISWAGLNLFFFLLVRQIFYQWFNWFVLIAYWK